MGCEYQEVEIIGNRVISCLPPSIKAMRGGLSEEGAFKLTPDRRTRAGQDACMGWESQVDGGRPYKKVGLFTEQQDT